MVAAGVIIGVCAASLVAMTSAGAGPATKLVFLVRSDVPFDAQTAGALAGKVGAPLLLTSPATLSPVTATMLQTLHPELVVLVGDLAAVSAKVEQQVHALGLTTKRVAGADRFATAIALAEYGAALPAQAGVPGPAGATGPMGATGPAGPSGASASAYYDYRHYTGGNILDITGTGAIVASKTVPAGSYLLTASARVTHSGSADTIAFCAASISATGEHYVHSHDVVLGTGTTDHVGSMSLHGALVLYESETVDVNCWAANNSVVTEANLTLLKVDTLS